MKKPALPTAGPQVGLARLIRGCLAARRGERRTRRCAAAPGDLARIDSEPDVLGECSLRVRLLVGLRIMSPLWAPT